MTRPQGYRPPASLPPRLDPEAATRPGLSLVTACRDRNANLVQVLPGWLALDPSEIVVVDWSSAEPVAASLAAAGIDDPRIRILRVEGEDRWVLSYAFNAGFRAARFDRILKADADIDLAPDFLDRNPLAPGQIVVGNWRRAAPGQQYVNGFFYTHRADLARVNGFSEYITTYGWDDDDLYDRMQALGILRVDVADGTVRHLDHDDAARLGGPDARNSGWADLAARPMYAIRSNRFLSLMLPIWDEQRRMLPLGELGPDLLARAPEPPEQVPDRLTRQSRLLGAYELLFWQAGTRVFDLSERGLDLLLSCRRFEAITELHVELALAAEAGGELNTLTAPRHLVADLDLPALAARPAAAGPLMARLRDIAASTARAPVLRSSRPPEQLAELGTLPFVSAAQPLGRCVEATMAMAEADLATPVLRLRVGVTEIAALVPALTSPQIIRPGAGRLVIAPEHGLGNRMRAIGSAAAIARATGRELVIAWGRDVHCEAPLDALFETDCAVTEPMSSDDVRSQGSTLLNNMEIGEAAEKGAPLRLEDGRDAYVSSAYVITHAASHWQSENAGLRDTLRPGAAVRDLSHAAGPEPFDIGLHVRMEVAGGAFDLAENWSAEGHAAIRHWRGESHFGRFMTRLDGLRADKAAPLRIFLAADQPGTRAAFAGRYGADIVMLPDPATGRGVAALQAALADMLCLARSRHFLASSWSSFSEVALRLSDRIVAYERGGLDF